MVVLPTMLAQLVGNERKQSVEGSTVEDVIENLLRDHPELSVHLFDEAGVIRPHVRIFHNDWGLSELSGPVAEGDTLTVLQAVSGGKGQAGESVRLLSPEHPAATRATTARPVGME